MSLGTQLFLGVVDALDDVDFRSPTALPGWTRAHVVAHVHYNAEALRRLVHWAATGERTPMYESAEQRAAEIEEGATLPTGQLRALVRGSAEALSIDLERLTEEQLRHEVVTAQGRTVPVAEVFWMRSREVAVHAVDLAVDGDSGVSFEDLPEELNTALAADALRKRTRQGEAAMLARWLTGRGSGAPALGPWL